MNTTTPFAAAAASPRRPRPRANRGSRPAGRGWAHLFASAASLVTGSALSTYAFMRLDLTVALGVLVYSIGGFLLFGVSAAYHLGPWGSTKTVAWWRRADHATIALFIAATYTPLCLIAFSPGLATAILGIAWFGAIAVAFMNLVWITHPRFLDVVTYLVLGWLIIPLGPALWTSVGTTVVALLAAGGVIYSVGALIYGLRRPGRNARLYGYHEHFHTATVIAAAAHYAAMWIAVISAAGSG